MNTTEQMTTYKRPDGGEICGEFTFVNDLDGWFDDIDEPIELTKEVWVRESVETVTVRPSHMEQCPKCNEWFYDLETHDEDDHHQGAS